MSLRLIMLQKVLKYGVKRLSLVSFVDNDANTTAILFVIPS